MIMLLLLLLLPIIIIINSSSSSSDGGVIMRAILVSNVALNSSHKSAAMWPPPVELSAKLFVSATKCTWFSQRERRGESRFLFWADWQMENGRRWWLEDARSLKVKIFPFQRRFSRSKQN